MTLVNPSDSLERQNEKLLRIAEALMRRVEQKTSESGLAYAQFERAALLEQEVRRRTEDLERALDLLHDSNAQLSAAKHEAEVARLDLADAVETVDGGFGLFGPDNRLIMSNSRFCKVLRDVRDQVKPGLLFEDYVKIISKSELLILPDGMSRDDWRRQRLESHGDHQAVFNVRLTDNVWIQVSEHRTASGGIVILQIDVSDLMRVQRQEREALRHSQARLLQATLDHLDQGVCIFDERQHLSGWNQRMEQLVPLSGLVEKSPAALPFAFLVDRMSTQFKLKGKVRLLDVLAWAEADEARKPLRFEIQADTGQTLAVFAQEMPDRGFVLSFSDVTAERKAAAQLAELNRELENRVTERTRDLDRALELAKRANASKTRFIAAASHDLLQPLSAAKLFIQSVPDASPDPMVHQTIDKAVNALAGAEKIIGALLDISRLDVEEVPFSIETVMLDPIVQSITQQLSPVAEAKGLRLRFVRSSLSVVSDPTYLRRIVQNLVVNAVRYTETGSVLVGVRRKSGQVHLEVWDTGPGIAEEDQKTIFHEFKRLNANTPETGLGLGLAIVSRACARLGHELTVRSRVGQGSCFSVALPIGKRPTHGQSRLTSPTRNTTNLNGLVVLIVENDAAVNRALSQMIEGWGGQTVSARSGEEALELLDEIALAPDVLVLDFHLDGKMRGTDVFLEIKKRYGAIPARAVSASRDNAVATGCRKVGLELMTKPIDKDALKDFLHDAASRIAD